MTKTYKGKALYNPSGSAGQYNYWATNYFRGCTGYCTYCYLQKGILKKTLGGRVPKLKDCFNDEAHAFGLFKKSVYENLEALRQHGTFLTFISDPFLKQTISLSLKTFQFCKLMDIPVKALTKQTWWLDDIRMDDFNLNQNIPKNVAIGFTLTGHDEMETGCAPNVGRVAAMLWLHQKGYWVWASIEPIIDIQSSWNMINLTKDFCDHYKIGCESGKKYDQQELNKFVYHVIGLLQPKNVPIYFKDSLLKQAGIERGSLPAICVNRDYNMFK